jgi:hypothetical protein
VAPVLVVGLMVWHWEEVELWHLWHLWHLHLMSSHILLLVVGDWDLSFVVSLVVWFEMMCKLLLSGFNFMDEFLELSLKPLKELIDIWEHKLEWIDVFVLVVHVKIFHLGVESSLLDVL